MSSTVRSREPRRISAAVSAPSPPPTSITEVSRRTPAFSNSRSVTVGSYWSQLCASPLLYTRSQCATGSLMAGHLPCRLAADCAASATVSLKQRPARANHPHPLWQPTLRSRLNRRLTADPPGVRHARLRHARHRPRSPSTSSHPGSGVPGDTEPRSRTGYTASRDVPRRSPSEATKAQASGVVPIRHAGGTWEQVPGQGWGQPTGQLRSACSDDHPAKLPGTRCDAVVTTEI